MEIQFNDTLFTVVLWNTVRKFDLLMSFHISFKLISSVYLFLYTLYCIYGLMWQQGQFDVFVLNTE